MNDEELKNKIKVAIKNGNLHEYLLNCLRNECELNALNLPAILIENASQRFKNKIKTCQQIEIDLSDNLIPHSDFYILLPKLDILRLKLAILYSNGEAGEITEKNYNEIKNFILNILKINFNFNLKLKYFNLTIKLLEKVIEVPQFNKEFLGALDLLKLFANENYIPNEANLQYISNLGRETNEEDIRKCFYGIIHELDEKLLLQDLLKQLLKIIKKQRNSPLIQFNSIFITKCLNDPEMDAGDLNQVISLACHVLEQYNEPTRKQPRAIFKEIFNQNLIDLNEFKKDFKAKISPAVINKLVNQSSQEKNHYFVADILQGLDFVIYFPTSINNKKIKTKLFEAQDNYNKTLEKKTIKSFRESLASKACKFTTSAKVLMVDVKGGLEELAENSAGRLKDFLKRDSETFSEQEKNQIEKKDQNAELTQAKVKLLSVKEKLNAWNLTLELNFDLNSANFQNQLAINPFAINKCQELIDEFDASSNVKFEQLTQQAIDSFKRKLWLEKSETDGSSWFNKIFRRGYINSAFTIKKIKSYLTGDLNFNKVNNFFSNQSFWGLLSYGIIRWPWMNKIVFSQTWAEQFYLPDAVNQMEELRNKLSIDHNKVILGKIMDLSGKFLPDKNEIVRKLAAFKQYTIRTLNQLDVLEKAINGHLNGKENSFSQGQTVFFTCDKIRDVRPFSGSMNCVQTLAC